MSRAWYEVANEEEIASPALLIFQERVEENIRKMVEIAGGPERLRPHVKTHKLAPLVEAQLAVGIRKFKCATIAEAEMCAACGAQDVLLAYQPVGPAVQRLLELQRRFPATRFSALTDAEDALRRIAWEAKEAGAVIRLYVDLDCGMHRTGIAPGPEAARLYRLLHETPGVEAAGLHAYDGQIHEADLEARRMEMKTAFAPVEKLRADLERMGFAKPALIAGGSPTFAMHAEHEDRELSPGTTVLWDFGYADKFPELPFQPAAVLLTRVVSKPGPNRLCLDLGHKAVAVDPAPPRVRLLELPEASPVMHSEEHLVVETPEAARFAIGACLHGIPKHVCPTVALHEEAWVVRNGVAGERWRVTARGRRLTV